MGFSDTQIKALERGLSRRNIRARVSDGKEFSYIEGWFAIAEANRIFGFDGWDRETIEAKCVQAREVRGSYAVVYTVRVRISVRAGDRVTVRDGFGTGEARGSLVGEAHDLALKAAETDATKRALVTFGKAFGLALHSDRTRRAVPHQAHPVHARESSAAPAPVNIDQPAGPIGPPRQLNRSPPALHDGADSANGAKLRSTVDKGRLLLSEPRRVRDKKHLCFVASQPCFLPWSSGAR